MKYTTKIKNYGKFLLLATAIVSICEFGAAQTKREGTRGKADAQPISKQVVNSNLPKVTQIDLIALKNLLMRDGENPKPLLINFWATWCEPCKAEFPDLVAIDADYRDKIDFITISLDELSEIDRDVPKFLGEMKAMMPAYLLKTENEEEAIASVYKDWQGGLPFTILFNGKGEIAYSRQGIIKQAVVRAELEKVIGSSQTSGVTAQPVVINSKIDLPEIVDLPPHKPFTFERGQKEAERDISTGKLIIKRYGLTLPLPPKRIQKLKKAYGIEIVEHGCLVSRDFIDYVNGYNAISMAEVSRKFGDGAMKLLGR
jgi:thiol-disulfide isomerase/thioredoxin